MPKKVAIPPLVGMIVFGCIARNIFEGSNPDIYSEYWADWIRQVCLCVILMMGGLELEFAGKGLTVVLLTFGPQLGEAFSSALVAKAIFDMPWTLSIALGFCLGAVSPAVLVPSVMILHKANYGTKKGIPTTMIAASSFDDIVAITVFGICASMAFESVGGGSSEVSGIEGDGEGHSTSKSIPETIGKNILEIASGFFYGILMGWILGKIFNNCKIDDKIMVYIKMFTMIFLAIMSPVLAYVTEFPEGKYISIIFFGYSCNCFWKTKK